MEAITHRLLPTGASKHSSTASLSSAFVLNAVQALFDAADIDPDEPVNISFADRATVESTQAVEQRTCVNDTAW